MASKIFEGATVRKRLTEKIRRSTLETARHIDAIRGARQSEDSPPLELPALENVDYYDDFVVPPEDYSPTHGENLTYPSSQSLRETITLEDALSNLRKGHVSFIGPAGSGKTTLLRSIARQAANHACTAIKDVEYVHFIDGKTLGREGNLTASKLLLFDILSELDSAEKKEYDILWKKTPGKFLIILDSLDTLPFELHEESKEIAYFDVAPVPSIVWNLLTGTICRGCKIITSSREHGISNFKGSLRPKTVISLAGLTTSSIEKITVDYLGEKRAREVLKRLNEISPAVIKLCSTPVFLALTLHGIDCDENFQAHSMTAVLCEVFCSLIRSSVTQVKNLEVVILKLAHFAYDGIRKGKVVFDIKELVTYGVREIEVIDLAIIAPKGGVQKLLQIDNYLYFCHLCLQEMLCAHHISRSNLEEFKEFLQNYIHAPRYSVVRRLLSGLIFDEKVRQVMEDSFGEIPELSEKRRLLEESLKERLEQKCGPADLLEQMITLQEGLPALKNVVATSLREIVLHGITLSTSDAYVIGSIVSLATSLGVFALIDCNLSGEILKTISSLIKHGKVEVYRFQVSDNKSMGVDGVLEFAEISKACSPNFLDMGNCALTPDLLRALRDGLRGAKVPQILLRENKNIGTEGYSVLGDIIYDCGVQKLGLGGCDLNAHEYMALWTSMKNAILQTLVLSSIIPHTPSQNEMRAIGNMVHNVAGELRLIGWVMDREKRNFLQERMKASHPDLKIILDEDDILTAKTELDKMPNEQISAKKICIAKTDVRSIGSEGGVVKIGKCEVHFPPGAVSLPTRFRVSLGMHTRPLPENNVRITSCLTCHPSMKFPVPVKVKLPTWCFTSSSEVMAYLMAQDTEEQDPYSIGSVPLRGTSGIIEFETKHFTWFWAYIKRMLFGEVKFKVAPTLHFNPSTANFTTAFHVCDQIIAEILSKQLKDGGFQRCPVMLDTVTLKAADIVSTTLQCLDPNSYRFVMDDQERFEVAEDFAGDAGKYLTSILTPRPKSEEELILSCRINPCETRDRKFRLVWPKEDVQEDGWGDIHIYGDINAGAVVL